MVVYRPAAIKRKRYGTKQLACFVARWCAERGRELLVDIVKHGKGLLTPLNLLQADLTGRRAG